MGAIIIIVPKSGLVLSEQQQACALEGEGDKAHPFIGLLLTCPGWYMCGLSRQPMGKLYFFSLEVSINLSIAHKTVSDHC